MSEPSGEWWANVTHRFSAHVREESAFLAQYEELVDQVGDPGTQFLLRMILDDERRHHALFEEMTQAALGGAPTDLPGPPALDAATAARLLEPTERFLAAEHDDQEQLRSLRRTLRPARDDTLWPLLVELVEIDTEKHITILEYLRARLRRAAKG
jgi:bacterioferritin (cytochrome b1)